jgi:UDP-N-acetylglucosamine diphosphorylase/glucosamine-1-phosphate N-acetyltransferase
MNYILFDDSNRENLLPFTFTRPIAEIRVGILTIKEKWEHYLKSKVSFLAEEYLSEKYPMAKAKDNILIAGSICPNPALVEAIIKLKPGETLISEDTMIASYVSENELDGIEDIEETAQVEIVASMPYNRLNNTWDIFMLNDAELRADFELLTKGRKSAPLSNSNIVIGDDIFVEEGVVVEAATLNSKTGPIYLAKNSEIMEGAHIRGPFALCDNAVVKMSAKIYGATTIGPYSKVAGELSNVVFFGYSNKAHDGFFGSSVIGEWCNIGADSNTSNLKNTYDEVRLWNYPAQTFVNTGLQFCGTIMGDHVKCGINSMFNTGTVIGCGANVFGAGFQRNFIASFSWGGPSGMSTYKIEKAIDVAKRIHERRGLQFTSVDEQILTSVYELTHNNRKLRF